MIAIATPSNMKLLRDIDILNWQANTPFIIPLDVTDAVKASHLYDSPIQPCSLDLKIGGIFIPGRRNKEGLPKHHNQHDLKPGHTAVVTTREVLNLPSNLAAYGFPVAHISSKGILMTNPGHIDPGFEGRLQFTLINMGKLTFPLHVDSPIVTILFFELAAPVQNSYGDRRKVSSTQNPATLVEESIERLSSDFLNLEERAKAIATLEFNKRALWATLIGGAIAVLIGVFSSIQKNEWKADFTSVQKELEKLDALYSERQRNTERDFTAIHTTTDELKRKLEALEKTFSDSAPSSPKDTKNKP